MKYIAFLRGINVGGRNKIKMTTLIKLFELLDFKNVLTYIQSGNVIFNCDTTDTMKLTNQIENSISETFGFLVKVIIRTDDELRTIATNNPFIKDPNIELNKLYVTFMSDTPDRASISFLDTRKGEDEKFIVMKRQIYLYCPNGYGRAKLNNTLIEKKLKNVATTRNWNTITSIVAKLI